MINADLQMQRVTIMLVLELFDLLDTKYYYSVTMLNQAPCVSIGSVGEIPCLHGYHRSNGMADRLGEMVRWTLGIPRELTRREPSGDAWRVLEFESNVSKQINGFFKKLNVTSREIISLFEFLIFKDWLIKKTRRNWCVKRRLDNAFR